MMPIAQLEPAGVEQRREAPFECLGIQSPGKDEDDEKNQDRMFFTDRDGANSPYQYAVVCDGATTSPYSALAAEIVASRAPLLFDNDGIQTVIDLLEQERGELQRRPVKIDPVISPTLSEILTEIAQKKYLISYQTTFVAVRCQLIDSEEPGTVSITATGCGDSGFFLFTKDGELRHNNLGLIDENDPFQHASSFTSMLPDSFDRKGNYLLLPEVQFANEVELLLCSDGLYDGFRTFKEMHEWLGNNRTALSHEATRNEPLAELHQRLTQSKGDDDISFIWMFPHGSRATAKEMNKDSDSVADSEQSLIPSRSDRKRFFWHRWLNSLRQVGRLRSQKTDPERD